MEGQRKHLKTWVGELIIEVSSLYSVAEYKDEDGNKTRKGEALAKRYLYGEFGGIPSLSSFTMLKGRDAAGLTLQTI